MTLTANSTGTANFISDPADILPLHDTLTYEPPAPVSFDQIRYGFDSVNIVGGTGGGSGEFTNWFNPLDVNADGFVSPIDVLGVVNALNSGGSGYLGGSRGGGEGEGAGHLYIDTSGDGVLSPIDALLVINHLNNGTGSGEGELSQYLSAGSLAESNGVQQTEHVCEVVGAEFSSESDSVGVAESAGSSIGPVYPGYSSMADAADSMFAEDEDELDELLGDLADERLI